MTPRDLLILNGIESPLVVGGEVGPMDLVIFLWYLNAQNDGTKSWRNERRKKKMMERIAVLAFEESVKACRDYVTDAFQDAPNSEGKSEESRPVGTALIVPLIVRVAKETGWDRDAILDCPLAQLFQILKYIRADALGREFCETAPSDAITNEFLQELNTR